MIDWLTAKLPFTWETPIHDGHTMRIGRDGDVVYETPHRLSVEGSFSATLTIRTVERGWIELSGNPSKFLQGHNVFGSDDLRGLVTATMLRVCAVIGHEPVPSDVAAWSEGRFTLSRIDVTHSILLGSRDEVRAALQALGEQSTVKWRGRGVFRGGTLYFGLAAHGKRASPWTLKLYCKGDELEHHAPPEALPLRDDVVAFADRLLRCELTLRTPELKRLEVLHEGATVRPANWGTLLSSGLLRTVWESYMGKMQITEIAMPTVDEVEALPRAIRRTYTDWKEGRDPRQLMSRPTFFRHKAAIKAALGDEVDISLPQPKPAPVALQLRRVLTLELRPVENPIWATPDILFGARAAA